MFAQNLKYSMENIMECFIDAYNILFCQNISALMHGGFGVQ